jgi:Carboxylesterase family/AMP-binding enzyme/AMP-binding enzyme C-terminal domain
MLPEQHLSADGTDPHVFPSLSPSLDSKLQNRLLWSRLEFALRLTSEVGILRSQLSPIRPNKRVLMRFSSLCLALPLLLTPSGNPQHAASKEPVVHLASGALQGEGNGQIAVFRGIPFAAPPVGQLRWREPQPVAPWSGTLDANKPSHPCMQNLQGVDNFVQPLAETYGVAYASQQLDPSEDCLYLNIWTPQLQPDARLPVMVWLHGGSNRVGSGGEPGYDGASLASRGVIVVTVNYRLGIIGFFTHPELTAESPHHSSGNYGLLDQIAALRWVQKNINQFGGDPGNVTVFGESAGSVDATTLMTSPLTSERPRFDLSSLKQVIIGGAAASPELVAQLESFFSGSTIMAGYGLTETSPVISTARPKSTMTFANDEARRKFTASAGWPFLGVEVRVVDDTGAEVPRDGLTVGEVTVRGDNVMAGYYRDPELTRDAIVGGWLRTGDMAVWNEERCLKVVDRKKDIIISGGENIASIELEHAIQAHPDVVECAVVAAPDPRWGEIPVAIVVTHGDAGVTADQLLEWAARSVARFKLPKQFVLQTDPLPKGGTGKILKHQLREQFWKGKEKRIQG